MVMQVSDKPGGATREVVVEIPVLGRYGDSWPLDCPKSEKIVRNFAEYLKQPGANQGFADIGMLFLLSTGEDADLDHVRKWARANKGNSSYPWHIGYGGGYRLYVNGKFFIEDPKGVDRRGGSRPMGRVIPKEWWPEFDGTVTLAAISFKKHHPRTRQYGGNISFFMQRMKVPPLGDD